MIMAQFEVLVHQVLKMDGGEEWGQWNFVLVWVQPNTMERVMICLLYSVRQYYHSSFLEQQRESQTTLFKINSL
jgi:hypothetical protein